MCKQKEGLKVGSTAVDEMDSSTCVVRRMWNEAVRIAGKNGNGNADMSFYNSIYINYKVVVLSFARALERIKAKHFL